MSSLVILPFTAKATPSGLVLLMRRDRGRRLRKGLGAVTLGLVEGL